MPCEHLRKWEMRASYDPTEIEGIILQQGYEPYAVQDDTTYFKRMKPCEECEEDHRVCRELAEKKLKFMEARVYTAKKPGYL